MTHFNKNLGGLVKGKALYLTGVGVGAFTCLTGEGDWWRPAETFVTAEAGTRGGVL